MPLQTCPTCGYVFAVAGGAAELAHCPRCSAIIGAATADTPGGASGEAAGMRPPIIDAVARSASSMRSDRVDGRDGDDDSHTRPVSPERLAEARAALAEPVSAQWRDETQNLPHPPSPPAAPAATQELPASAAPAPQVSGAGGRGAGGRGAEGRGALRGPVGVVALVGLSLALVAGVALATRVITGDAQPGAGPSPTGAPIVARTPTAGPALGPGQTGFSAPHLYALGYPTGWLVVQRNTPPSAYYTLLTAPAGGASVNITVSSALNAPDPATFDQQTLAALAAAGSAPTHATAAATVTVGGQAWTQIAGDATLRVAGGQPAQYAHVVAMSVVRGGRLYTITMLVATPDQSAAAARYRAADEASFQPLLASFTFLS